QRSPADPDAIRGLTVERWAPPVESTGLIRTLHADGVRLFVESGPRGNLSAFVEDILRGQPFAALPADTPRRSGVTQLNHLAGQLAAHHVPLNLEHFYSRREPKPVAWKAVVAAVAAPGAPAPGGRLPPGAHAPGSPQRAVPALVAAHHDEPPRPAEAAPAARPAAGARGEVMQQYLGVMEQLIDLQHQLMQHY